MTLGTNNNLFLRANTAARWPCSYAFSTDIKTRTHVHVFSYIICGISAHSISGRYRWDFSAPLSIFHAQEHFPILSGYFSVGMKLWHCYVFAKVKRKLVPPAKPAIFNPRKPSVFTLELKSPRRYANEHLSNWTRNSFARPLIFVFDFFSFFQV